MTSWKGKDMTDTSSAPWKNRLIKTTVIGPRIAAEPTPFVLNNRLYVLENHPRAFDFPEREPQYRYHEDEIRVRDADTDKIVCVPLRDHYFGTGFVWNARFYLFAGDYEGAQPWYKIRRIIMTSTADLVTWTKPCVVLEAQGDEHLFNTAVCRGNDKFVLLYETDNKAWVPLTFQYCESDDLIHWKRIPGALYNKDKYVGGPALYYEGGRYYTLYLEALKGARFETRVTRSTDLLHWEDAPEGRPFLTFDPTHRPDPEKHPEVYECNASDAELCYWNNKTLVYFYGGNQLGVGDLQRAEFNGTPRELLEHYFA